MRKILGLTAALCLVAASAAFACPKDGDQASAGSKCMGAKSAMAASHKSGAGSCCDGGASGASATAASKSMAASGGCPMGSAACAKMEHTTFSIQGLNSTQAAGRVRAALAGMSNVSDIACDTKNCTGTVCWKGSKNAAAVARKLSAAGYKTAVLQANSTCPYASGASAGKACPHGAVKSAAKTKTT